ncbi:MAG TPA: hypothetical protein VJT71_05380 [Pyrinomonadaceae bacterium]|nr:hypothetical protein [Pyrinomonadaceae bacterium]
MTASIGIEANSMREQRLLNLICVVGALLLLAFVAYNFLAAGSIISTDGLFFTVVPTLIALTFLAVPAQEILMRKLEQRKLAKGELTSPSGSPARIPVSSGGTLVALRSAPALKDARGRALPPDVNRMVAEMNKSERSGQ